METQVILTRGSSVAEVIEGYIGQAAASVDAALYRFNNPRLARALQQAMGREVRVRLVLDRNKYEESRSAQELLSSGAIPFRLLYGRQGVGTKMHHKFAILDGRTVLTGSYNWTLESEEQNYESLLILQEPEPVAVFQREFARLWDEATALPI
jgi:phosphatidylserine/phosphatidylglycerophosphate/cardiolipin synthase-like enzyme